MPLSALDIAIASICLSVSLFFYRTTVRVPKGLKLPPGPPGHFIWGNLNDLPFGPAYYKVYEEWAHKYGDLVYLNILGQSMLFINSPDIARELFTRRGAIYSDRFKTVMLHDLTDLGRAIFLLMDHGERWNRQRIIAHDLIGSGSVLQSYQPLFEDDARSFARRLTAQQVNDLKYVRYAFGGFILQLIYGIDVLPENDPYVELSERATASVVQLVIPGAYKVDSLPFLKYLPSWFPGVKFHKVAEQINKDFHTTLNVPFEYSKKAFKEGKLKPCFVLNCLENSENSPHPLGADSEEIIREVAVVLYLAGIDTLEVQMRLFFLAMALYPDVQRKAQEELDKVVGRDNLPSFADLPNLPYLNALVNESLRWHAVAPVAAPHQLKQDDVINGYFIPKGTSCFGNTWFFFRSEKEFGPDPDKFRPERFLDGSAKLRPDFAFGYGRRICSGKAFAENFLNIMIATVLHVVNISELENEPLAGIIENEEFIAGSTTRPRDFRCRIDARPDILNILDQFGTST